MYSKNIHERISPASLTKLMTAILFLEKFNINEQVTIIIEKNNIEGKIANLESDMVMQAGELLDFLLVYSANDAAHAIAMSVSNTEQEFIFMMNEKATSLGMKDTNFMNSHGLDDPEHYTTLYDLLLLSLEVINYDEIIVSTGKQYFNSDSITGVLTKYYSTNELINDNFNGLKTGWTKNAGLTFIGLYQGPNRNIITLVNKSKTDNKKENHFLDTLILKELSIETFALKNLVNKGDRLATKVNGYEESNIYSPNDLSIFGNISTLNILALSDITNNTLEYTYSQGNSFTVPLPMTPKVSIYNHIFFWLFR